MASRERPKWVNAWPTKGPERKNALTATGTVWERRHDKSRNNCSDSQKLKLKETKFLEHENADLTNQLSKAPCSRYHVISYVAVPSLEHSDQVAVGII